MRIFEHRREIATDEISRQSLLWLTIAFIGATLPFWGIVPAFAHLTVVGLAIWRYRIQVTGGRLPHILVRTTLFFLAIAATLFQHRTIFGMEAATLMLLILAGLKLLEMRAERDFVVLACLTIFLILNSLFFYAGLPVFCYGAMIVGLTFAALMRMGTGVHEKLPVGPILGGVTTLFLQALPLIAVLYLFFPRLSGVFGGSLVTETATTGMSETMNPGDFAGLSLNDDPVMRVVFPDDNVPATRDMYWRAMVLWDGNGFSWSNGSGRIRESSFQPVAPRFEGRMVRQRITLEPHHDRWLFCLDRPTGRTPRSARYVPAGAFLRAEKNINSAFQYEVISAVSPSSGPLTRQQENVLRGKARNPGIELTEGLRKVTAEWLKDGLRPGDFLREMGNHIGLARRPFSEDEKHEIIERWKKTEIQDAEALCQIAFELMDEKDLLKEKNIIRDFAGRARRYLWKSIDEDAVAQAAMNYFQENDFRYTTAPGPYGREEAGIDEFMLERRRGFCEHYAASVATLLRTCGVPARVVIGYQGGTYNRIGNYYHIREYDAHAWAEYYSRTKGWTRLDPTLVVAPDRIDFGMEAFSLLEDSGVQAAADRLRILNSLSSRVGLENVHYELGLLWDTIEYQWSSIFLTYDSESQDELLGILRIGGRDTPFIWLAVSLLLLGILIAVYVAATAFWSMRKPLRRAPPSFYKTFLRKLRSSGLSLAPHEGPRDFSVRAKMEFPALHQLITEITSAYESMRYGEKSIPKSDLDDLHRRVRQINVRRFAPSPSSPSPNAETKK